MKADIPWYAQGTSGKYGDRIYYQRNGKTYVKKAALHGYNKIPTEKQLASRLKFTAAVRSAIEAMQDPVMKAKFEAMAMAKCTAYAKAISVFLNEEKYKTIF